MAVAIRERSEPTPLPAFLDYPSRIETVCPHCAGRLFREPEDYPGTRTSCFMQCVNCARCFDEDGNALAYYATRRRVRV